MHISIIEGEVTSLCINGLNNILSKLSSRIKNNAFNILSSLLFLPVNVALYSGDGNYICFFCVLFFPLYILCIDIVVVCTCFLCVFSVFLENITLKKLRQVDFIHPFPQVVLSLFPPTRIVKDDWKSAAPFFDLTAELWVRDGWTGQDAHADVTCLTVVWAMNRSMGRMTRFPGLTKGNCILCLFCGFGGLWWCKIQKHPHKSKNILTFCIRSRLPKTLEFIG